MTSTKHYVEFLSPGTFFSEQSRKPIDSWSIPEAVNIAAGITERHAAKPYGFRFVTMLEAEPISDGRGGTLEVKSREIERSGFHWLGGRVRTYDEVCADDLESERILRSNMQSNIYPAVVENNNSWKFTGEFSEGSVVVDGSGAIVRRADEPELLAIKQRLLDEQAVRVAEWRAERAIAQESKT